MSATCCPHWTNWSSADLLRLDLVGAIEAFPERTLLAKLERIGDPAVRDRAPAAGRLVAARDQVGAPPATTWRWRRRWPNSATASPSITGLAGERRPGETYAGRTLVVRGHRPGRPGSRSGRRCRSSWRQPLCLLLDSARWLVAEIGEEYEQYLLGLYERRVAQTGDPAVPLAAS